MAAESFAQEIADLLVRVYEIHDYIVSQTGGMEGLRDLALLHSAIARPFATFEGQELYSDDFLKSAALFHSLIKNHPFLDGTKRTAFASTLYFLDCCGYSIPKHLPMNEVIQYCVAIAEENARAARGEFVQVATIAEIADWFRRLVI